jgi:hypothetical protein
VLSCNNIKSHAYHSKPSTNQSRTLAGEQQRQLPSLLNLQKKDEMQ